MPGIRLIAFLTLTVLATSCSSTDCECWCGSSPICDSINRLKTCHDNQTAHIQQLLRDTSGLTKRFDNIAAEEPIREVVMKMDNLEVALKRDSREVKNRVAELEENTSNSFIETANKRTTLRIEMERKLDEIRLECDRQRNVMSDRLNYLESLHTTKLQDHENKIRNLEEERAAKSEEDRTRKSEIASITNTKDTGASCMVSIHNLLPFILVLIYCIFYVHINSLNMFL